LSLKTVQLQHLHMVHLCFAQDLFQSQMIYHPAKMSSSRASKAKQYASSKWTLTVRASRPWKKEKSDVHQLYWWTTMFTLVAG